MNIMCRVVFVNQLFRPPMADPCLRSVNVGIRIGPRCSGTDCVVISWLAFLPAWLMFLSGYQEGDARITFGSVSFLFRSMFWNRFVRSLSTVWRLFFSQCRINLAGYLVSLVSVGLATLLRIGMDPILGDHHPFTLYFASVAIAAWYGGFRPALLAIICSYFGADWFFITPRFEINLPHENPDEFLALVAFLFSCFAIAITSAIMRRALARARQKQRELEAEITERQRAQQALQEAQAQLRQYAGLLEHRVHQRAAHLQETVRSLEGVCYHLAHDLRAPLRAIEGFTSILLKEYNARLDPAGVEYLQSISKASHRMDLLIHGLMEYGRMGHGSFPLQPVNARNVLRKVLARLRTEISSKRAEIELGNHWPEVIANDDLLEIIFSNLLQNSLKFLPPGLAPRIRVWAESPKDSVPASKEVLENFDRRYVRFVVQDNGIGIPAEFIWRAFWIFERLHPGENFPGTGIGLAIASKAVERMDGRLGAHSEVNAGSRFWFQLQAVTPDLKGTIFDDSQASHASVAQAGWLHQVNQPFDLHPACESSSKWRVCK